MMETDALIARLANEPPPPPFDPGRIALIWVLAMAVPVALFLLVLGPRPDLIAAWSNPAVIVKTILPLGTVGLSLPLLLRLARPEARAGATGWLLVAPAIAALVLWAGAFALRAPAGRFAEVSPASLAECLGSILLLSVVPAVVILRILRRGATSQPRLSAALAGLTASAGATAGYSLFCTQDNPLFFITWYGVAILAVTVACAAFGERILRW